MERLTKKIDSCTVFPEELIGVTLVPDNPIMCKMLLRLAAYEDTGLEPESVEALKLSMMGKAISEITEFEGLPIDRLRELAEADKAGRVAILPCEVGGAMLDVSVPERPQEMKDVHFSVSYVSSGIVFSQPMNIFLENIAAGYIKSLEGRDDDQG